VVCLGCLFFGVGLLCFGLWFPLGTSQAFRLLWPCSRFVLCATPLCAHSCCVVIGGGYPSDG
jgi:hypothetical protein